MALADIDAAATARRIQDIADAARKSFQSYAEQSAQLDAAAREAVAKEEADLEAAQERQAQAKQARQAEEHEPEQEQPKAKPTTLSLGAEEFKLDREARQAKATEPAKATELTKATEQAAPPPEAQERPSRTLKLGARDDEAVEQDKPVRKRPPRPEGDDDMSGRTWLR